MQRIAVVGCGGSGKTRLARRLGAALGARVIHLDALHYDDRWRPTTPARFAELQRAAVSQRRWVIDGNYAATLPIRLAAADTVVFLDLHAVACLWGVAQRRWRYRGGQHPRHGVYDRITLGFLRYVTGYRRHMRPRVLRAVAEHAPEADIVVLRSRRAAQRWSVQVGSQAWRADGGVPSPHARKAVWRRGIQGQGNRSADTRGADRTTRLGTGPGAALVRRRRG